MNHLWNGLFARHEANAEPFLHLPEGAVPYRDFVALARDMAGRLRAAGLEPGDRVALQLEKSPGMLAVIAGAMAAGVVFLPLNPAYTPAEVAYFVGDAEAKLLLAEPGRDLSACGARVMTLPEFCALGAADRSITPRGPDDLAALLYTSGTTGRSKGAMMSHDNLLSNARVLVEAWRFTRDDVLLHALPIFHTHGLFVATNVALLAGASMIFQPGFRLDAVIGALPRATVMMGVPTFYTRLLDDPRLNRDLVAGIRLFVSGSAPLLAETHRAWEARTGHMILERYGMTETNMITSNLYEGPRIAGTVGPALAGVEVKICDAAGKELPRGEIGVLELRGPNVFQGYWRMPEKTAAELRADGFFITGDLAVMAPDGWVTIVGRAKDLVISGGFNVYPKEVELALDALPGVLESAVFGVPHPDFGEAVVAAVVAQPGAVLVEAPLLAALARDLAKFKQPKRLIILPELPRNSMGKVQKAQLRQSYAALFT